MSKLYLAYGSNLLKRQMYERCPTAKPVGRCLLESARLVFRGVADLDYEPSAAVPCGIWRLQPRDEETLDRYEGVGSGFYTKGYVKLNCGTPAMIYLMNSQGIMPPSAWYCERLRQGYKDFGLDPRYIDEALRHSYDRKAPDDHTRARRARQRISTNQQRLAKLPIDLAIKRLDAS